MKNKRFIICFLALVGGCSTEKTINTSTKIEEVAYSTPAVTLSTPILKEKDWQTIETKEIEIKYYQFETMFEMEVNTEDLSEVDGLEEFKDIGRLEVQYLLTSKKYGNLFLFDITENRSALYACEIKNNEVQNIETNSLEITKDPNRFIPLTKELFSIIQDVIVFNDK